MCRYRAGTGTRPGRACGGTAAARGACRDRGAAVGRSVCVGGGSHSAVTGRGGPGSRGRPGRSVWWGHSGQGMFVGGPVGVSEGVGPSRLLSGGGRSVGVGKTPPAGGRGSRRSVCPTAGGGDRGRPKRVRVCSWGSLNSRRGGLEEVSRGIVGGLTGSSGAVGGHTESDRGGVPLVSVCLGDLPAISEGIEAHSSRGGSHESV